MITIVFKVFLLLVSLLTIPNFKKVTFRLKRTSSSKKRPRTNLKVFQYNIKTSVKSSKTQLLRKTNFRPFFNSVALIFGYDCVKGALSGLRQCLATETLQK